MNNHVVKLDVKSKVNNNETFRSFKSKENIHTKEVGTYRGSSNAWRI